MTTGERIRAARKKKKMTQAELAEKLNISYVGVSQWENGIRNPKFDTIMKIADALDIDWTELISEQSRVNATTSSTVERAIAYWTDRKEIAQNANNAKPATGKSSIEMYFLNVYSFDSDEERIKFLYQQLNTDGVLIASRCMLQHIKPEDTKEVIDELEQIAKMEEYRRLDYSMSGYTVEQAETKK